MKKTRIKVIANQRIPYNIDLFNGLNGHPDLSVSVLYLLERERSENQGYTDYPREDFRSAPLGGWTLGGYACNPAVIREVLASDYDALIIAGYHHPSLAAAVTLASMGTRPWMLWGDTWKATYPKNRFKRLLKKFLLARVFRRASAVLTTGSAGVESVVRLGCPPEKAVDFPYVIDPSRVLAPSPRAGAWEARVRDAARGRPVSLFVGQLIERKGPDVLVDAVELLSRKGTGVLQVIAGQGPLLDRLQSRIASAGLRDSFLFTGFLQASELAGVYRTADMFVLPTRWDAWGVSLVEGMAAGLPVITTADCMAARDLVDHGVDGLIVPKDDAPALAEAMRSLIAEPSRREQMGAAALHRSKRFTPTRNAETLAEILRGHDPYPGRLS